MNNDHTLADAITEWINVLQAFVLPLAVIPLLQFTRDESIMGKQFTVSATFAGICWTIAIFVMIINNWCMHEYAMKNGLSAAIPITLTVVYILMIIWLSIDSIRNAICHLKKLIL